MAADPRPSPEFSLAVAEGQSEFFVELAHALAYELRALGVAASVNIGEIPLPRQGLVHVFLPPHEYVSWSRYRPPAELLRRSIVISAEQPDTHYFAANVPLARDAGAVFDINARAVRAYRSEGIEASLLELGYTRLWDRFEDTADEPEPPPHAAAAEGGRRDIDILFLGRLTPRRSAALASYAGIFERFRCHIALSDDARPNIAGATAFVAGDAKRDLLARSKVMLNIHGEDEPYFEWLRVSEAICSGCAVVSEHSSDIAPLKWGRHLLTGRVGSLGLFCAWLAEDDVRRENMRHAAYQLFREERPLSKAALKLIEAGRDVTAEPVSAHLVLAASQERVRGQFREEPPSFERQPPERANLSDGEALILRAVKQQMLNVRSLRRELAHLTRVSRDESHDEPDIQVVAVSPAWNEGPAPALSVIIPLYNDRRDVICALGSLERASTTDWEAVIVDDASTDGSGGAVRDWMIERPQLACRLIRHELNRGLAAARNTGVEHARTDRLLMLDADNEIRPTAIGRLLSGLAADPRASFAYGIMERFSASGSEGLVSCFGWDPQRLRGGNYIDAFALLRRDALEAMGGYSNDERLYGWEDYDLWVRMAEAGKHGVFVPEIIGRYRVRHGSMIAQTNVSTTDAYAALIEHAPKLLAGLRVPR
ncbi:MAG: hypothetical protein JWL67_1563 [Solirubrobacterales bacterium]|nr:hypothetical protein [Solirubrobacterales bacterium]